MSFETQIVNFGDHVVAWGEFIFLRLVLHTSRSPYASLLLTILQGEKTGGGAGFLVSIRRIIIVTTTVIQMKIDTPSKSKRLINDVQYYTLLLSAYPTRRTVLAAFLKN